jgi:hypothetical protein
MQQTDHWACPMQPQYAYRLGSVFNQTMKNLNRNKHVSFTKQNKVHLYDSTGTPSIMLTYDSGANEHYTSKQDQCKASLHILGPSTQWVGVVNGGRSKAKYVARLLFCKLFAQLMQADTFQDFPSSLMSIGNTANNGTVSVFTKEGVNVFKEEDVLITCKGKPVLIGIRDNQRQYQIPNTVNAATRTMATTMSIQTSTEGTTSSQQCLQSSID